MSGLVAVEAKWETGRINVLIGEGQTAQILRNLCYQIVQKSGDDWLKVCEHIREIFGAELNEPKYLAERGEILMTYKEKMRHTQGKIYLDLSCSGRGLQQTLLLLAYIYVNPGSVLLLDEPDAHLEILRQRQIYLLLTEVAKKMGSQVIAASHSEVVLNEAADRDLVIAFVGRPHRIDNRKSQVRKSLTKIGFEQYLQAEQVGWVLYLEGSSDLAILQAFARRLRHPASRYLEMPFVYYVGNQPQKARDHFYGLVEAKQDLIGIGIYDRGIEGNLQSTKDLKEMTWERREIENYLFYPKTLISFADASAQKDQPGPLFAAIESVKRKEVMKDCIEDIFPKKALRNSEDRFWKEQKASEVLDELFEIYFEKLGLKNLVRKSDYHELAELIPMELIDAEVKKKLNEIVEVARNAKPTR